MAAVLTERLVDVARAVADAGWGRATAIYDAAAHELGMSRQTLIRKLKEVRIVQPRKQRKDAGQVTLTKEDAELIAATVEETRRLTGTGTVPLEDAVELLRANGRIRAGRVDESTGEFFRLSTSAIRAAMRQYGLHPDQLGAPTPASCLSSPHPNWCWQNDPSVSRQYYLAEEGARIMPAIEFYRGKPQNFEKISARRLWRYVTTDHASGCLDVFYTLGAESTVNVVDALVHAMVQRPDSTMHGVPKMIFVDPGSAMKSGPVRNFCQALDIQLHIHKAGNSRATGQVENSQYLVETHFEATLKLQAPITSLADINARAERWCRVWNSTREHSRTGMTRRDGWLRITPEQLVLAPSADVLRQLALSTPKQCTMRDWRIKYRGKVYDVSGVPALIQGAKCEVVRNPFDEASVRVLIIGADGRPSHVVAPEITRDDWGFLRTAAQIGTNYRPPADTRVDENRKAIERLAMDATSDAEALAKRKAKALPFGGTIDPERVTRETVVMPHLPRAGTASTTQAPAVFEPTPAFQAARTNEAPVLTPVEAAMRLVAIVRDLGGTWSGSMMQALQQRYANGVPSDQLDVVAAELLAAPTVTRLRSVS